MIYIVLPVMERGPTDRVTREERLFFPGRNGPARPSAAGRPRLPGHSRPFCVGPAECLRSPAYIRLTTCIRCKRPAFYKPAASAPLRPFQREVARSVCCASLFSCRKKSSCSKRSFLKYYFKASCTTSRMSMSDISNQRPLLLIRPTRQFLELPPWPMAERL
jgi:hypothetical protein